MRKIRKVRYITALIAIVIAISLVRGNLDKLLFASDGDGQIVFAYGKTTADLQDIAIMVNEEQATMLEITTPTQEVSKLSVQADMKYELHSNGIYIFRLLDKDGSEITKVEQEFSNLKKLDIIEKAESWKIISRSTQVTQVEVAHDESKEIVPLTNDGSGNSYAMIPIPQLGSCRITPLDQNGVQVGDVFEYTKKNNLDEHGTPVVALKKQITSAKDLHLILEQPDGIYELTSDFDMSGMNTLDVIFSGTLEGNGYQLYNIEKPLFLKMDQAEVSNVHLQGDMESNQILAGFALQGVSTHIKGSSFQGAMVSEKEAAGFFVTGDNVTIENSYVSAKIEAKKMSAGFIASGNGSVSESFVSGVLKAEEDSYGFGKDIEGKKSYVAANIWGKNPNMFNKDKSIEDCFYDESLNDFEDVRATAYSNTAMTSSDLDIQESFTLTQGKYPQIKEEISENWSDKSKRTANLSVFALSLNNHENMATLEAPLYLPTTMDETAIKWNNDSEAEAEIVDLNEEPKKSEDTILMAKTDEGTRYFATRNAQLLATDNILVGERTAASSTTISFNATNGYYYKIAEASEVVNEVHSHKDAINAGFKKRVGTGIYNVSDMKWNTTYKVYETDLSTMTTREATTKFGLLGGSMSISGTVKVNETIQANLADTSTTTGTWSWFKSQKMDSGWTPIIGESNHTLTLKAEDLGYYIKAVFTADPATNVQDELTYIHNVVVKQDLGASATISISGNAEIGSKLSVNFEGGLSKDDFDIQWYQKSSGGEDVKIGTGLQHDIVSNDIGKQLYAIASTKTESYYIGSITSNLTSVVIALAVEAPTERPMVVAGSIEDTTVIMKMPDTIKDGLYRFGYQIGSDTIVEFPITVRGNNPLTITGLTPGVTYSFRAKRIGENGYLDSPWGNLPRNVTMADQYIKGYLELTGNAVVGETLDVTFKTENSAQNTETKWYRVKDNVREPSPIATGTSYVLKAEDVGYKIEVETAGIDGYAGFVRAFSETVVRAFVLPPTGVVTERSTESTAIEIQLPTLDSGMNSTDDKFIIGISDSANGYPIEYNAGSGVEEYAQSSVVNLTGLKPNTTYYIYLRYAMNGSHYRSDWSIHKTASKTLQEAFSGTIRFGYTTDMDAVQGQKISAKVTSTNIGFEYDGTWEWYRISPDGSETKFSNFYPERDGDGNEVKNETYFIVPEDELVGTKYKVVYIPDSKYTGTATNISSVVKEPDKESYDAPNKPDEVRHSDATITVKMPSSAEGIYQFGYSQHADGSNITEVEVTGLGGAEVIITGLQRNTIYYVYSRRSGDSDKGVSPWSITGLEVKTELTNISGYISLETNANYGTELIASYHGASYNPIGDDSKGSWQWYQNDVAITGATSSTYTPVQSDIGTVIKVIYTASAAEGFKGSKSASTDTVKKAVQENPNRIVVSGNAALASKPGINAKFHPSDTVYYRLQKASEAMPSVPTNSSEIASGKWKPSPKVVTDLYEEYTGAALLANMDYILYLVKVETATAQASSIVAMDAVSPSLLGISGSVELSGDAIVGKTLTATLKNSNNATGKGTWKWYRSTEAYPTMTSMPSLTDTTKWTQVASGYVPTKDSLTSVYTLTNDDFAHYMKAEFVSEESAGYSGNIQAGNTYTKKIFVEEVTIDGKGYPGETITINLKGSRETGELSTKKVRIMDGNTKIAEYEGTITDNQTFTATIPNDTTTQNYPDGYKVIGAINVPDEDLYVNTDGTSFVGGEITTGELNFKSGIPISNANDLENFILGVGNYSNRAAKYVITDNINMSSKPQVVASTVDFSGILDGDYHSLSYVKNRLIGAVGGTSAKYAEVKNIIFTNGAIASTRSEYQTGAIAGQIKHYSKVNRVFALNTVITGAQNTGLIAGFSGIDRNNDPLSTTIQITECGSAGGIIKQTEDVGPSVGGLVGFASAGVFEDNFSISSKIKPTLNKYAGHVGGFIGHGVRYGPNRIQRNYTTAEFDMSQATQPDTAVGAILGNSASGVTGSNSLTDLTYVKNNFYDKQVTNNPRIDAASITYPIKGLGKNTVDMIGTGLQSSFGNSLWTYSEGFYPRLTWMADLPIAKIYAATRGSFASIDGKTTSTELFDGKIGGTVQLPEELLGTGFSASSSDESILKIINGDTIVPLKNGTATITITYTEPDANIGGSASNSFTFTSTTSMSSYDSVTVSGTPMIGNPFTSTVLSYAAEVGSSYQWYRKEVGSANSTATEIPSATASSYTPTASDLGYQLRVKVSKSGYGSLVSNWSDTVSVVSPNMAPTIDMITDNGFVVTGKGSSSSDYEYGHAESETAEKIIFGTKGVSVTFTGMQRNKEYYVFSRIAGGDGYDASAWSPFAKVTTRKTDLEGTIAATSSYNAGSNLTLSVPDTNLQEGTWSIQRVDGSSFTDVTSLATTNTTYQLVYPLTSDDIGKQFEVRYIARGNFQGELSINRTDTVKKQFQNVPIEPQVTAKTDTSFDVSMASPESGITYSFGYRSSLDEPIVEITTSSTSTTIHGLSRNTNYYLYAKKNAYGTYEASDWSAAFMQRTHRSNLSGNITKSGNEQTEGTLVFTAPSSNNETGRWTLERYNASGSTTLDTYTISNDGRTLTYTVVPDDAGNKLRATFSGTLDFQSMLVKETDVISTKGQDALMTQPTIVSSSEYSIEAIMNSGSDMFQFGYRKTGDSGDITLIPATVAVGKSLMITGLQRNSNYEIYVRKAAKTGYDASGWNTNPSTAKTGLSSLNGNISYTGSVVVGEQVNVQFNTNSYPQPGNDGNGTWSWFLDGTLLSETGNTLTIPSFARGNPELKVVYEANMTDGFQGSITRTIGKVTKNNFTSVDTPVVTALAEDGTKGSKIKISTTNVNDVYYYIQSSDLSSEPVVVLASEATTTPTTDAWVKATPDMIFDLAPNKGYQVFAARLETDTNGASSIVTGNRVQTVKEELRAPVVDKDVSITWKANQERTLYYTQYGEAPTGTWSIYVTNDLASDWQNIDSQIFDSEQGIDGNQAYIKFEVPMKFTGNYVKAVFTGVEDYTGKQEYISRSKDDVNVEGKLIGQTMTGYVEILNPDATELLIPINVQYVGDDEKNGIWTWYRETAENSDTYETIAGATNTGVTSTYTPTAEDFNRNIYAVYSANPKGLYSGKQQSNNVKQKNRSSQNKPDKVGIKEINGTRILVSPPKNFKSDLNGTMPQVVLGYKEAKDKNDESAPITWQLSANYGNNWFNNLKVNTAYVFYAKFLGTPTYTMSDISDASDEAVTMNRNFVNTSYKLQTNHDLADSYIMDVGNSLTVTYSDEGWDEGYFRIKRSNGDIIANRVEADISIANQARYTYRYQNEDVGTHIIVEYVAKDDAIYHSGSIVTATSEPVTKPIDKLMPIAPTLTSSDHTTLVLDRVNAKYEYALTPSITPPDIRSGEWDKLPAADGATYEFSNVTSQNSYYIHVRIAETATSDVGDQTATAGPFKVEGAIDLGTITLNNVEDELTIPSGTSTSVILPNILRGDTLTIQNVKMTKDGIEVSAPQTSVNEFVNGDKPHENVFVKGSNWGDQHYASNIQVVDDIGNVISSSQGDGTSLSSVSSTTSIQLQMYRVNAIKESGTYEWTCELQDADGTIASYKAKIEVETQIKAMVPIKIDMYIRDGYINQTSNTEVLVNDGMMPLDYQMDEFTQPGSIAMPDLLGIFKKPLSDLGKDEVYLKISSDGSNFTKEQGIWMRTNGASKPQSLALLGAKSKAGYFISGISDKAISWPWESEDNRVIPKAYLFHFVIDVSKTDIDMKQSIPQP